MDGKEAITIYPSYWIYNAGIVGIIRTLENFGKKDGYDFKDNSIVIQTKYWNELKKHYVQFMSTIFGRNWFYGKIAVQSAKGGIFTNNNLINGFKLSKYEFLSDLEKWLTDMTLKSSKISSAKIGKWRLLQWVIFVISRITESDLDFGLDGTKLQEAIKDSFKQINDDMIGLKNIENRIFEWADEKIKELMLMVINYLALKAPDKWSSIWDNEKKAKKDVINVIEDSLLERLEIILKGKKRPTSNLGVECSVCGEKVSVFDTFQTKWFSYEGGSTKGFENFYYNNSTQLPICSNCQLVFYFSPLGIYPDSDTRYGEFINIPDASYLWELNKYRMDVHLKREGEPGIERGYRSKLIDAVFSSGSILQLKSRWLLQNIELIEIGGKREKTVYNFTIDPVPLKVISDYSTGSMAQWLTDIERIQVRPTAKFRRFTNGREIIDNILNNNTGWIIKTAVLLFKLFFEKNKSSENLNDFNRLISKSLKPLLLVNLSLLNGKTTDSEFLRLGRSAAALYKNDDFEKKKLPLLFNCIYSNRKNDFVELLIRAYMKEYKEIDRRLLDIFKFDNLRFQTESLLLLIGILEGLYKGEKNVQ